MILIIIFKSLIEKLSSYFSNFYYLIRFIKSTGRKDMGYLVGYPISSGLILSRDMGKSNLNIISLKRYRDGILMGYPVKRYIYKIVLNISITNKIKIISRDKIFLFSHFYLY